MPIYEFQCLRTGELFEEIRSLADHDRKLVICRLHFNLDDYNANIPMHDAERIWSVSVTRFEAPPTIIFKNPRTGELQVATSGRDVPPPGFIKQELRGPIERSKFEKEASERRYIEDELTTEKLKQGREETAKNIHDDIKARMNAVTNKVYNPETKQEENVSWDAETKALMKRSMEHTRKKHSKIKPKRTNIRLDVNHLDSSNLIK